MSIIRPFTGKFPSIILAGIGAGIGAIICTGALAQQYLDTGSSQVTVDLGVIEDSGYGAGVLPPAAGGRRLLLPGPEMPVSRLLVAPPEGSAPPPKKPMMEPAEAKAEPPMAAPPPSPAPVVKAEPAPVEMKAAALPPPPPMPAPAAPEPPAVKMEAQKGAPKADAMAEKKPAAPKAEPPMTSAPAAAPPPPPPPPPETKTVKLAPAPEVSKPSPPPVQSLAPGLAMQVAFPEKASKLPAEAKDELKGLAVKLRGRDDFRLQLLAYAGGESLSPSKARRLSLSRALSVRSFLIESGVHSTRIDVRALGNKTAEGPINRVDVNVAER